VIIESFLKRDKSGYKVPSTTMRLLSLRVFKISEEYTSPSLMIDKIIYSKIPLRIWTEIFSIFSDISTLYYIVVSYKNSNFLGFIKKIATLYYKVVYENIKICQKKSFTFVNF